MPQIHVSHQIGPGTRIKLKDFDPGATPGFSGDKAESEATLRQLNATIDELQLKLYAQPNRSILLILQGMDTSGKDGTIRDVFEGVSPAGVRVVSFKAPAGEETKHDYLWRIHREVPASGEFVVFNRSHYESVLIERVRGFAPEHIWKKRYDQINTFEEILAEHGTVVVKCFLHISRKEQAERLQRRLDDPRRNWKFNPGDLEERKLWDRYMEAYEDAISKCSTKHAPWHIVPADKKWYRNLVVASALVEALEGMKLEYPKATFDPKAFRVEK
jgi:PPK2 family polyphosphate:nucleotide phosphotransferase